MSLGLAQAGQFLPGAPAIGAFEQRRVLRAGVNGIGVGQRSLHMPDAFEFPRMLRAVVPLVRADLAFIDELVALAARHAVRAGGRGAAGRFPGPAAVIRTLDNLSEPAAGLRSINAVRVHRRALEMIQFPPGEMRAADFPILARAIGSDDECALACAN